MSFVRKSVKGLNMFYCSKLTKGRVLHSFHSNKYGIDKKQMTAPFLRSSKMAHPVVSSLLSISPLVHAHPKKLPQMDYILARDCIIYKNNLLCIMAKDISICSVKDENPVTEQGSVMEEGNLGLQTMVASCCEPAENH